MLALKLRRADRDVLSKLSKLLSGLTFKQSPSGSVGTKKQQQKCKKNKRWKLQRCGQFQSWPQVGIREVTSRRAKWWKSIVPGCWQENDSLERRGAVIAQPYSASHGEKREEASVFDGQVTRDCYRYWSGDYTSGGRSGAVWTLDFTHWELLRSQMETQLCWRAY